MKHIKITTTFLFIILLTNTSCKKYLDTKPTDFAITSTYYSSKQQVDYALAGIYQNLKNSGLGLTYMNQANAPTDESYYLNGSVQAGPASYTNVPSNGVTVNLWNACYTGINQANTLIANIGNAQGLNPTYIQNSIGEALFLRSYYYFMLAQWFGGVPLHLVPASSIDDGQLARAT